MNCPYRVLHRLDKVARSGQCRSPSLMAFQAGVGPFQFSVIFVPWWAQPCTLPVTQECEIRSYALFLVVAEEGPAAASSAFQSTQCSTPWWWPHQGTCSWPVRPWEVQSKRGPSQRVYFKNNKCSVLHNHSHTHTSTFWLQKDIFCLAPLRLKSQSQLSQTFAF